MSRLDAHWNCRAGFTRFSGRGAHVAPERCNYTRISAGGKLRRWANHLRAAPACSCVQTWCALAWARRTPSAACKLRKLRAVHAPEKYMQIYIYIYIRILQVYRSSSRVCTRTMAYARIQPSTRMLNVQQSLQIHVYSHAFKCVRGIRGIVVVRARMLTAFSCARTCTRDLLSYVETTSNYAITRTISRTT